MSEPEPGSTEAALHDAILQSSDRLLAALDLEQREANRFRATPDRVPSHFADRVFGGQLMAQAVVAAGRTLAPDGGSSSRPLQSLHGYFVATGDPRRPLDLAVDPVRDGRSFSTRRVEVIQDDRTLVVVIVSFHDNPSSPTPELPDGAPAAVEPDPGPDHLPPLQHWARDLPSERREQGRDWLERPPPLDMRIGEAPNFLGGAGSRERRTHWMRLPRAVPGDLVHAALLVHASDYLLLDMLMRARPVTEPERPMTATSLDHSLWIHLPVRFDRWHRYTQEVVAFTGHRGLVQVPRRSLPKLSKPIAPSLPGGARLRKNFYQNLLPTRLRSAVRSGCGSKNVCRAIRPCSSPDVLPIIAIFRSVSKCVR